MQHHDGGVAGLAPKTAPSYHRHALTDISGFGFAADHSDAAAFSQRPTERIVGLAVGRLFPDGRRPSWAASWIRRNPPVLPEPSGPAPSGSRATPLPPSSHAALSRRA